MNVRIRKAPEGGSVAAPESKSVTQRLIIAGALSGREDYEFSRNGADDIRAVELCMREIASALSDGRQELDTPLRTGESGAVLRFILPIVSVLGLNAVIEMGGRLPERPLSPLTDRMKENGAVIIRRDRRTLALWGKLRGGLYRMPGNISSQFISGLMMALPLSDADSRICTEGGLQSRPYVNLSLHVLKKSGIVITEDEPGRFSIPGNQKYKLEGEYPVEGDWSCAAFWLAAGACQDKDGLFEVTGLYRESVQGDRRITALLEEMGADISLTDKGVSIAGKCLKGITVDCKDIPDLVPALAVAAVKAEGETRFINAGRLRFKESDRLSSIATVINALGGRAYESPDGLVICGGRPLKGGRVRSFGDHRIAMMAASLRSQCEADIILEDAGAVDKSYPGFFGDYETMGGRIEEIR